MTENFNLMLMRHAKSDWHNNLSDIERPLNSRGKRDASDMGEYLRQQNLVPDRMIVSAAQRTQETAALLQSSLQIAQENIIIDKELYLASSGALREIAELYAITGQRLLLLAHNPGMDEIVSYLASEPAELTASGKLMTTCAVACFHMKSSAALQKPGQGELQHLIRPCDIAS
jgi:phosphohistidine phosphatase